MRLFDPRKAFAECPTDFLQLNPTNELPLKVAADLTNTRHLGPFIRAGNTTAGGGAPDPLVAKGLREFSSFIQGYGLTRNLSILALNRVDNFKDDAAQLPLPNVQIKINQFKKQLAGKSGLKLQCNDWLL